MRANLLCAFLLSGLTKFDCKKDAIHFIGNKGRAAELAAPK